MTNKILAFWIIVVIAAAPANAYDTCGRWRDSDFGNLDCHWFRDWDHRRRLDHDWGRDRWNDRRGDDRDHDY